MKRTLLIVTTASLVMLLSAPCYGATEITLDHVEGLFDGDPVVAGDTVRFVHRLTYTPGDGSRIHGATNGFKVWTHRNGAYTDSFTPIAFDTLPIGWDWIFTGGIFLMAFGVDGMGADTAAFGGFSCLFAGTCIEDGFDQPGWYIETMPYQAGDTLCIDSVTNFPYLNEWMWSSDGPLGAFPPDWGGPYCFEVEQCCVGNRGNVDMVVRGGSPADIADLVLLKYYLFEGGEAPPCAGAGNVDGIGGVNVADLTYFIDYLFRGGPAPPPCP
jgi:hypothetical protein